MKPKQITMRTGWLSVAVAAAALAVVATAVSAPATRATRATAVAGGYGWPIAPFDRAHPVRAGVGDPRTLFRNKGRDAALSGPGSFSFHNGVDIDARNGTHVYPVLSGTAHPIAGGVIVRVADGRSFVYEHIVPAVSDGQWVTARQTVIGRIKNWAEEVHFTEVARSGRAVNPLLPGHLTPYVDTTTPTIPRLLVRNPRGSGVDSFDVRGRIELIAEAYDGPMPVAQSARRTLSASDFAYDRFPLAPAAVTWSLSTLGGRVVVPPTTVVDFRAGAPRSNAGFWGVYARGTYQNRAVISARLHWNMPGRYLFKLTHSPIDTLKLANGIYRVTITAVDTAGNRGTVTERLDVWNPENKKH